MLVKWKVVVFLAHLCALCTGEMRWIQYSYNSELEGFIKLHTEPADWHSARVKCHMEGAFLASPWFAEFASVISKLQTSSPQLAVLFSGVHKTFAEGALTHFAGKLAISTHPNELIKIERCGVFLADGSTGEVNCDESLPFVCYRPASDPELDIYTKSETEPEYPTTPEYFSESYDYITPTEYFTESTQDLVTGFVTEPALSQTLIPDCGEINLGYEFSELTKHCYKFHAQAVYTWYDAKAACEAEGAYLAIVNSDVEAQVLKKLFEKYPAEKIHGAQYTVTAAIGNFKNDDGIWVTINGETLEEAGYSSWRPYGPHPWAKLGFIYRDGLLSAFVPAIRDVPFICEIEPFKQVSTPTTEEELAETTEKGITETVKEEFAQKTEEDTVQATEEIYGPTTEEEPEQTTKELAKTTEDESEKTITEELAQTTEKEPGHTTEENLRPTTYEDLAETTEDKPVKTTTEELAKTTEKEPSHTTEENFRPTTDEEPEETTQKGLEQITEVELAEKSEEDFASIEEYFKYLAHKDNDRKYGYYNKLYKLFRAKELQLTHFNDNSMYYDEIYDI